METLDDLYKELMLTQREMEGGHRYPNGLTSTTFPNLVLEDQCPWEWHDFGNGKGNKKVVVPMKCMMFPAAPVRNINLSAPTSIVYWLGQRSSGDVRKSVEAAIYASYCTGYHHFYHIGSVNVDELAASQHPFHVLYKKITAKFNGVAFGNCQSGGMNPLGFNFKELYLDNKKEMNSIIDGIVDCILRVLHWINDNVDSEEFHHVNIEKHVNKCLDKMREEVSTKTEFAEF